MIRLSGTESYMSRFLFVFKKSNFVISTDVEKPHRSINLQFLLWVVNTEKHAQVCILEEYF